MRVRFLGTGTPIGQRGLHQACILVETLGFSAVKEAVNRGR